MALPEFSPGERIPGAPGSPRAGCFADERIPQPAGICLEFRSRGETASVDRQASADRHPCPMPGRLRRQDIAVERSRAIRYDVGRALRDARLDRDPSLRAIAAATGISVPVGGRIERGVLESVTFEQVMRMAAAVGLDLMARLYPPGNRSGTRRITP